MRKLPVGLSSVLALNIGYLGMQFAWALEVANMSGIYSFFHAKENNLGLLWLALPITGLIVQLIIGYFSDKTKSSYGKRAPYIFWGGLLTALCMIILPNSLSLVMATLMLWAFTATINATAPSFRSLISDSLPESMHTMGYSVQAFFIGAGSVLASLMPWLLLFIINPSQSNTSNNIPIELKFSFYIGAIILIATNLITVSASRRLVRKDFLEAITEALPIKRTFIEKFKKSMQVVWNMPKVMRQVSTVQFFTWMGVFCFIVYLTPMITENIFGVPIGTDMMKSTSFHSILEQSVILTGKYCAAYTLASVVFAFMIPKLSERLSRKFVLMAALFLAGLSLLSMKAMHEPHEIYFAMIGVGIAWASFNSIPFAMIARAIPKDQMGLFMGLFNVAVCLPQILVGVSVSWLLKTVLHESAANVMLLAGLFFIIAAVMTAFVDDREIKMN